MARYVDFIALRLPILRYELRANFCIFVQRVVLPLQAAHLFIIPNKICYEP